MHILQSHNLIYHKDLLAHFKIKSNMCEQKKKEALAQRGDPISNNH